MRIVIPHIRCSIGLGPVHISGKVVFSNATVTMFYLSSCFTWKTGKEEGRKKGEKEGGRERGMREGRKVRQKREGGNYKVIRPLSSLQVSFHDFPITNSSSPPDVDSLSICTQHPTLC